MGPDARRPLSCRVWRPVALALVLAGVLPLVGPGRGQAAGSPDPVERECNTRSELIGAAASRVAAAGPIVGGLNLEAGFGRSAVDLSGEATRGESATMSAGAASLFLALSGAPAAIPEPTRVDSNGPTDGERSVAATAGDFVRVGHEKAHAEPRRSDAVTRLGDLTIGEAAAVFGGSSTASINDEGARSSASVGEVRLGGANGPAVVLSGLVWHADQAPGAPATAGFSVGAARIGGEPLAVGSPDQVAAAIDAINGVLAGQGIRIYPPVVTAGAGGGRVDALRIELRDPPLNRAVAGAVYSPLAPTVNETQDAAVKAGGSDPRLSQALLGANVALSLLLGNGGVGVEVGGAVAGLTRREVPDLGSLLGGSQDPRRPDSDSESLPELGGGRLDESELGPDAAGRIGDGPFDRGNAAAGYGPLPAGGAGSAGAAAAPLHRRYRGRRSSAWGPAKPGSPGPTNPVACPSRWRPRRSPPGSASPASTGSPAAGRSMWLPGSGPPPASAWRRADRPGAGGLS